MNITKRDVLELRRRMSKKECTISRMCGCYVNNGKTIVLKFNEPFLDLQEDEFFKYLEIAKKTLSGTLGNSLLELSFNPGEDAAERQAYLLALKKSGLTNEAFLDRLYEQIMEQYRYAGNYLILLFHDKYDVMTRTSDRMKLDESEEIYEYIICAICPVELSKAGLGYLEDENRIGVRLRDWVVGMPDLGFVYPAFSQRSADVNSLMYYVKNGKDSHPEICENVLCCPSQRTAIEEKETFHTIISNAFGEEEEQAKGAFLRIQKNLNEIVVQAEEETDAPPFQITKETVSDLISDVAMPDEVKTQIEENFSQHFKDALPTAQNLLDSKLLKASMQQEHALRLEEQVSELKQKLAEQLDQTPESNEQTPIVLQLPPEKAELLKTDVIDGQKFLLVPLEEGESACINGKNTNM